MQKLLCLIALLVSAVLCQSNGQQGQVLHIRFVHAVQNGPNVDIYAGSATQSNLLFGTVRALTISPYANVTSGSNGTIIVTEAGNTNNVLITASSLPVSGSFTGIISLNQGMTTVYFVNDSLAAPLSQNQSSIRFMFLGTEESFFGTQNQDQTQNQTQGNTTSVAGAYSIQIQNGTTVVMNANLFDKEFERVVLPAGTYTFSILRANQTVGTIANVTVVGGRAYTVLVFGSNNGQLIYQVVEDVFAFVVVPSQSSSQSQTQSQTQTQTAAGGSAATTGVQSSSQSSQSSQSSSQTQASTVTSGVANTVVIVTGVNRPNIPSSAGSLRVDVAVFGVVCAVLFALFH